mmetsp:Transcript_4746/g.5757  ORF Transcript_4746/g.5757 Transcript_4746/m.5757 type:complete len:306 (+) Transcript_4746:4791-5708(+)
MININYNDDVMNPKAIHNINSFTVTPDRKTILILTKEYHNLLLEPIDGVTVHPDEENICVWYFLIHGPINTPYYKGLYIGVIIFPPNFPYSPPEIQMISPNGKFKPRRSICLSLSSFHEECWNASWTFEKIIVAFVSFMVSDELATGCYRNEIITESDKLLIAKNSKNWLYCNCSIFKKMFQNEYQIMNKIYDSNLLNNSKDYLISILLNEPLQISTNVFNVNKRLDDYIENYSQIELVLLDYPQTKRNEIVEKFFKLSTTREEIRQLELFHSEYYQVNDTPSDSFLSDDVDEEEPEFYSTEDEA